MVNLTISVDEQMLRRARIRALEEGTSVNAVLRQYLETYAANDQEQVAAIQRVIARAKKGRVGSGPEGRIWTREDLYDRTVMRRR